VTIRTNTDLKNGKLCSLRKLSFRNHGAIKLTQNCIRFSNPCINLFVLTSVTREYHPEVLEGLHLLQCISAYRMQCLGRSRRGARASKFLGVQKFFSQIFPNFPKKLSCCFCRPFLWRDLQKNGLHLFFCKPWAPFFVVKQRWAPFLPRFSGISPRCLGILFGFSEILPKFSGILPGFSTNQNFWGCTCSPASYTNAWASWETQYLNVYSAEFPSCLVACNVKPMKCVLKTMLRTEKITACSTKSSAKSKQFVLQFPTVTPSSARLWLSTLSNSYRPVLSNFLGDDHISYCTTVREPDLLREVIFFRDMLHSTKSTHFS